MPPYILQSETISIHALREEGDFMKQKQKKQAEKISIHALREEGDPAQSKLRVQKAGFLSTPSARRATEADARNGTRYRISIHALREEGDVS